MEIELLYRNAQEKSTRYALTSKKCYDLGINTVLTAHHLDDLIENHI